MINTGMSFYFKVKILIISFSVFFQFFFLCRETYGWHRVRTYLRRTYRICFEHDDRTKLGGYELQRNTVFQLKINNSRHRRYSVKAACFGS